MVKAEKPQKPDKPQKLETPQQADKPKKLRKPRSQAPERTVRAAERLIWSILYLAVPVAAGQFFATLQNGTELGLDFGVRVAVILPLLAIVVFGFTSVLDSSRVRVADVIRPRVFFAAPVLLLVTSIVWLILFAIIELSRGIYLIGTMTHNYQQFGIYAMLSMTMVLITFCYSLNAVILLSIERRRFHYVPKWWHFGLGFIVPTIALMAALLWYLLSAIAS